MIRAADGLVAAKFFVHTPKNLDWPVLVGESNNQATVHAVTIWKYVLNAEKGSCQGHEAEEADSLWSTDRFKC